jgi:hypothetical protein
MTDKQLHKLEKRQVKQPILEATEDNSLRNKRRRLLKGTVAIPVIMTLYSGAALARSSNYFGEAPLGEALKNDENKPICVEGMLDDAGKVDVGDGPTINAHLGVEGEGCGENGFMISQQAYSSLMNKGITISTM